MANIFDYLSWRGDLSFSAASFNPVDNIILSQLSYLPLDGIVPGPGEKNKISIAAAAKAFAERQHRPELRQTVIFREDPDLLRLLGSSKRFRNCKLFAYVNNIDVTQEKQFSALSIITGDKTCFVAYRGTDATFIGWKEDFNMSYSDVIPAQIDAVKYLEKIARHFEGPLRIGGHSKGGNLAVYAAANCKKTTRSRISAIYSNDAPGFHRHIIESEGFMAIRERISSYVPQSSIVGMLLEHGNDYSVVKSSGAGLVQHILYFWEVTHNNVVKVDTITRQSRFVDKTLQEWINNLDYEQRQQYIDALFSILNASQAKSIHEFTADWFNAAGRMIKSLGKIDKSTRKLIRETLFALFRSAGKNMETLLKPESAAEGKNIHL